MSIKLRLTIMFLVIASIPLLFVSVLTFTQYKNSLETARLSNLQDIAAFKADKIETYFNGLMANITVAQGYYNIKKNLSVLTRLAGNPNDPKFNAANKMLDEQLQEMQSVLGLSDIMLVNSEGKIVYTSNVEHQPIDFLNPLPDPQQKAFSEGKNRVYLSDVYLSKAIGNKPAMLVTAPVFDFDGVFIGVIAFEVDMSIIYKLIQDMTGLGDTGEVLVGKKKGNEVVYLNPLRHDPDAALKKGLPLGGELGGPIQEAVQGRKGASRLLDYRGKNVIAAWRYLPSLDWGMVAKIDTEEAFAEVINLRNLVLIIVGIVFSLSGIIAFSIAQSISVPIKTLSQGAEIIGRGNLDHKIGSTRKDEIGRLSRSFDKMTEDLKKITASRAELNREITERKKLEEKLLAASLTDELTGLLNRRGFFAIAKKQIEIAKRDRRNFSILYLDLNEMKKINDEFGHKEGDQALRDIATILNNTFRASDSVARMGGDEFIVLITEPNSSTIEKTVAQHIHNNLRIHNEQTEKGYRLAVSMGMAHYDPERPCSPEELLARADELMYQHKLRSEPIEEIPSSKGGKSNHREHERQKTDKNRSAELVLSGNTTIRNISTGGILVRTSQRLTKNTIYTIKMLDDNNEELSSKGRVVWSSLIGKGAEKIETEPCYEAGLQFIGRGLLSDGARNRGSHPPGL